MPIGIYQMLFMHHSLNCMTLLFAKSLYRKEKVQVEEIELGPDPALAPQLPC